jgi:hypothetical protein
LIEKDQINRHFPKFNSFVDLILVSNTHYICFKDLWTWNISIENIFSNYLPTYNNLQIKLNDANYGKIFVFILLSKKSSNYNNLLDVLEQSSIIIIKKNNAKKIIERNINITIF